MNRSVLIFALITLQLQSLMAQITPKVNAQGAMKDMGSTYDLKV